ncbi:hypothetical protein [Candidatus Amarobacter glycogenicus]|uniref:hypothetical protein n=1 Tax=Candidatus Amarobacter glycogenicus TaxID=3140699 RepID=UPI003135EC47|nr:hypothetical protein [Dehalococcoidia bacterium]
MTPEDERRGRILILGLPYFGALLADALAGLGWRAEFLPHPGRSAAGWARVAKAAARADIVYLIGSRIDRASPQDRLLRLRRRPVVIHWVGTDVQIAVDEHRRHNISLRVAERPIHWCDAPWLVDELRTIGVVSEYVPLPIPIETAPAPPLPETFSVLLYYPVDAFDREVFDIETMLRLPLEFPAARFVLIPSPPETLPAPLPRNLEARAWVDDMEALYRETTVVVRLTSHDGQSFMAAEALSRGRYVIWTHPMPGCIKAEGPEAVTKALGSLLKKHDDGVLKLNTSGRRAALERFGKGRPLRELDERLRGLLR